MISSRRATAALAFVCVAAAGPACATRTAAPAPERASAHATAAQRLAEDLDRIFDTAPADGVLWGVSVREAGGERLYRRNSARLLHPASTMKLVTLAAAVERLGWDFRFETTVRPTTALEAGGVIRGDLVITGSGDPSIGRRHGGAATLASWADRLWELGVRRIEGRIIGDGSAFGGTTLGSGWQWDDLAAAYAAPVNALSYNENTVELLVAPGPSEGALAAVTVVDRGGDIAFANAIRTVSGDSARRLSIERATADGRATSIQGEVPIRYAPFNLYLAVADPPLYFARAFREALRARGIAVVGEARSAETDPPGPFPVGAEVLVRHQSPPLRELAATLMKVSQNLYAELFLQVVAAAAKARPAEALAPMLAAWGVGPGGIVVADGSGLSRYDLITAETLDAVLSRMFDDPAGREPWIAALPVAGVDGTLQRRMKGTPAQGRVYAKTGSIAYVRGLAGYAQRPDGRWIQFAILGNNFAVTVTAADVDRVIETAVLRLLAP